MQRLALLLRRPAIPVPSVLLTATLMCVTSTPPSLLPCPPSSLPHFSILAALPPSTSADGGGGPNGWLVDVHLCGHAELTKRYVGFVHGRFFFPLPFFPQHLPLSSEWIKNSSCCSGREQLPGGTAKRWCWALWVISAHLWDTERRAHPASILLALFLFL